MNLKGIGNSCFILVNINIRIIHYSIRHKLLLKCAKHYYIWSRRVKDSSKYMHWPRFLDYPVCVFNFFSRVQFMCVPRARFL